MGVTVVHEFAVWEIMLSDLFGDTGFQGAFDRVPQQIVCAQMPTVVEEDLGVLDSEAGQLL